MLTFWQHLIWPHPAGSNPSRRLQTGLNHLAAAQHLVAFHVFDEMLFRGSPQRAQALWLRGWCSLEMGYADDAIADCLMALQLDGKLAGAHLTLAHAYYQTGQLDAALLHLDRALQQGVPTGLARASLQQLLQRMRQDAIVPASPVQQALHILTLN